MEKRFSIKRISIAILSALCAITLIFGLAFTTGVFSVNTARADSPITFTPGAQIRTGERSGIRYIANIEKNTMDSLLNDEKTAYKENCSAGMIIIPQKLLANMTGTDVFAYMTEAYSTLNKSSYSSEFAVEKLVLETDAYIAKAALVDLGDKAYVEDYVAYAYYTTDGVNYSYSAVSDTRNLAQVAKLGFEKGDVKDEYKADIAYIIAKTSTLKSGGNVADIVKDENGVTMNIAKTTNAGDTVDLRAEIDTKLGITSDSFEITDGEGEIVSDSLETIDMSGSTVKASAYGGALTINMNIATTLNVKFNGADTSAHLGVVESMKDDVKLIKESAQVGGRDAYSYTGLNTAYVSGQSINAITLLGYDAQYITDNNIKKVFIDLYSESATDFDLSRVYFGLTTSSNGALTEARLNEDNLKPNGAYVSAYNAYGAKTYVADNYGQWVTLGFSLDMLYDNASDVGGFGFTLYTRASSGGILEVGKKLYISNVRFETEADALAVDGAAGVTFGMPEVSKGYMFNATVGGRNALGVTYHQLDESAPTATLMGINNAELVAGNYERFAVDIYIESANEVDFASSNLQFRYTGNGLTSWTNSTQPIYAKYAGNQQYIALRSPTGKAVTTFDGSYYGQWVTMEFNATNAGDVVNGFLVNLYLWNNVGRTVYFSNARLVKNVEQIAISGADGATFGFTSHSQAGTSILYDAGIIGGKQAYAYSTNGTRLTNEALSINGLTATECAEAGYTKFTVEVFVANTETCNLTTSPLFMVDANGLNDWGYYTFDQKTAAGNNAYIQIKNGDTNIYGTVNGGAGFASTDYGVWLTVEATLVNVDAASNKGFGFELLLYTALDVLYIANPTIS